MSNPSDQKTVDTTDQLAKQLSKIHLNTDKYKWIMLAKRIRESVKQYNAVELAQQHAALGSGSTSACHNCGKRQVCEGLFIENKDKILGLIIIQPGVQYNWRPNKLNRCVLVTDCCSICLCAASCYGEDFQESMFVGTEQYWSVDFLKNNMNVTC